MTGSDVLQAVQFVTVNGRRLAVLDQTDWEALIEWIETLEDRQIAQQAQTVLAAVDGDRQRAGWLRWDDVKDQLV